MTDSSICVHIDYAADDSCMIRLWAKGHHAPEVFVPACEVALREWDGRESSLAAMPVKHCYYRTVQADAHTKAYGVCETVRVESRPGQGAYAATVLDQWIPMRFDDSAGEIEPACADPDTTEVL